MKVEIVYFGKRASVDADQVELLTKKEALVKQAAALNPNDKELPNIAAKIIRLNQRIRKNVVFL